MFLYLRSFLRLSFFGRESVDPLFHGARPCLSFDVSSDGRLDEHFASCGCLSGSRGRNFARAVREIGDDSRFVAQTKKRLTELSRLGVIFFFFFLLGMVNLLSSVEDCRKNLN